MIGKLYLQLFRVIPSYHVGEVESGAQFDQAYDKFDGVQSAFLEFVKKSIGKLKHTIQR